MKKSFQSIFTIFFIFCMILGISTTVFASETDIDTALEQRGYPKIVLETLDTDLKEELLNEKVDFAGATMSYYNEEEGVFSDLDINEDGTYISPKGQISTSDLSLAFIYCKYKDDYGRLNYIKVIYNYKWLHLPICRWQDPIAVSWDSSKFEMADNSFRKYDKYDGYYSDGTNSHFVQSQTHSYEPGFANASPSGVSWYADLKGYVGIIPTSLYGYATFNLVPKNTTYSGSSTLYGHYVHPTIAGSISVDVETYGSFSISGISSYDDHGSQHTIS